MEKLKSRGKNKKTNEWVYGYYYEHQPPLQCFTPEVEEKSKHYILKTGFADWNMTRPVEFIEVDYKTIGRYIGRKDENNIEIYEKDIVDIYFGDEQKWESGIIKWCEEELGFYWYDIYNVRWKLSSKNKLRIIK